MRKLTTIFAALGFMLAGCNNSVVTANTIAIVDEVQTLTAEACAFVPTAATIISIIAASSASAQAGAAIAAAVCKAVTAAPLAKSNGQPEVRYFPGTRVAIKGSFVTVVR